MGLVEFEIEDHKILHIFLNQPQTGNALSLEMAELILNRLEQRDFKAFLISHHQGPFCAGGNLRFYQSLEKKDQGLKVNDRINQILHEITHWPVPKACFIDGLCLGGGIELATCFDHIVASPRALFGLWQRRIGLTFGWGGEERLLRRLSSQALRSWRLSAKTLSVYEAQDLGLIDQVATSSKGFEQTHKWLQQSLRWGEATLPGHLDHHQKSPTLFSQLWMGPTHQQALKSFQ